MGRALPCVDWPEVDRALFDALYDRGSILDGPGPFASHRPATRRTITFAYACWLGWLALRDPSAFGEAPVFRATPARLVEWVAERGDLSPVSLSSIVDAALKPLFAAAPNQDWSAQRRIIDRLQRRARRKVSARKTGRIRSSGELLRLGMALATANAGHPPASLGEARKRRDGAMVAVLALMPLRRRAFCGIELGRHLDPLPPYRITVDPGLSKTGAVWSAELPAVLAPVLDDYLRHVRPYLASRSSSPDSALWLNDYGRRLAPNTMTDRISAVTRRTLGVAISPHLFRDAAATTVTSESPKDARTVRDILGHKGFATMDRHYNHAKMIEASRRYAAMMGRTMLSKTRGTSR